MIKRFKELKVFSRYIFFLFMCDGIYIVYFCWNERDYENVEVLYLIEREKKRKKKKNKIKN